MKEKGTSNDNDLSVIVLKNKNFTRLEWWYLRYVYLRYATLFGPQRWMYVNKTELCMCVDVCVGMYFDGSSNWSEQKDILCYDVSLTQI